MHWGTRKPTCKTIACPPSLIFVTLAKPLCSLGLGVLICIMGKVVCFWPFMTLDVKKDHAGS